jgi:acetyltransferase EpsM
MKNLIIIGASGHGCVIEELASKIGYSVIFWDDNLSLKVKNIENLKAKIPYNSKLIIGIGSNNTRANISKKYSLDNYISLFHPESIISGNTKIGVGTVVMAGAIINNNVNLGKHCILNTGAIIDHDCVIDNFVHISPSATLCGNVKVGEGSHIGAGATIIQNIIIGKWCIVGAGAVITKDIPDYSLVVGVPGKIIKKLKNE